MRSLLHSLVPLAVSGLFLFSSGGLNGVRIKDMVLFAPLVGVCILVVLLQDSSLKILGLGEELPITLGLSVWFSRMMLVYGAVLLCAGMTVVTGPLTIRAALTWKECRAVGIAY